ncbi:hypothetical protein R3W88_000718 [Solanum pinnatisectum]|uniref:Zinc finger RING-type eukaryotic domain-containing protein n=1 Tax=Solanum pinnatisectum TaxID=50273 RepID=A0AAV9MG39_9SOLN|nr:hypothetical protein R3W88_000718 [Solanum pinnatisectum]
MWRSISNAITSFGRRRNVVRPVKLAANSRMTMMPILMPEARKKGLNAQYVESFNIVENIPYVLWCGHTLCKHCLLGLKSASWKFSTQQSRFHYSFPAHGAICDISVGVSGNLKSPSKNFFLLWMVESKNGSSTRIARPVLLILGNNTSFMNYRRVRCLGSPGSSTSSYNHTSGTPASQRAHSSLHKSLDLFIRITSKFPLVLVLLLLVMFAIPSCAAVLALYLLITILFGLPSFLVLYFAYPACEWLIKEITT